MSSDREIPLKARLHWYRYEDPAEFPLLVAMVEHDSTGQHIYASRERLAAYAKLSLRTVDYLLYGRPASTTGHKAKRGLIARAVVTEKTPANAMNRRQPARYQINEAALELDPRMKPEWIKGKSQLQLPGFEPRPPKPYVLSLVSDDAPRLSDKRPTHTVQGSISETLIDQELIRRALREVVENPDRKGTERLIAACVSHRPDAQSEEIAYWIAAKAKELRRGNIDHPMGFLISVVPECFAGEAFSEWRNLRAAENEQYAATVAERAAAKASVIGRCRGCGRPRFASSPWSDFCTPSCRAANEPKEASLHSVQG